MEETKCIAQEGGVNIEAGFVRNVRNAEGWKMLRLTAQEMKAADFYLRSRHFCVAAQVVQDVKDLAKHHRMGATERSALMKAMMEKRCESINLLVEHMLTQKAAKFHEMGAVWMSDGWKLGMIDRLAQIEDILAEQSERLKALERGRAPLQMQR